MMCVKEMKPLRIFQVEKMVVRRAMDSTIMMNDNSLSHVEFRKDKAMLQKYIYECKDNSLPYYVYFILEVLCYQCGFFSWDQIRKC